MTAKTYSTFIVRPQSSGDGGDLPGTTEGDLIVHNGAEHVRLPVGSDGQVLKADSAEPEGVKWADEQSVPLNNLSDVVISEVVENDLLAYNASSDEWTNQSASEAGVAKASHTHDAADITAGTLLHERGGLEADVSAFEGLALIESGSTIELRYNRASTRNPGSTDDASAGYAVGSVWVNVDTDAAFICLDATNSSAVWKKTTDVASAINLGDLSNVEITSVTDNEVLAWDEGSGKWINQTGDEAGLGGGGGSHPVDDTTALVQDPDDNTKLGRIDVGAVAAGTTRALFMPDRDVDFTALVVGTGLSSGDGTLHVHTASAGAVNAPGRADDLVVENTAEAGITILAESTGTPYLVFGRTGNSNGAQIYWDGSNDRLHLQIGQTDGNFIDSENILKLRQFSDASRPAAGTAGRIIFNTDDGQLNIDNGNDWTLPDGTVT